MNFKMRMRKLDIRSIRAPSDIRVKLIELNALPPKSPVCGLLQVAEVERLARSYGVVPPDVLYDVFAAKQSGQKKLPSKRIHPGWPLEAGGAPPPTNPPFLTSRHHGGGASPEGAGYRSTYRIPKLPVQGSPQPQPSPAFSVHQQQYVHASSASPFPSGSSLVVTSSLPRLLPGGADGASLLGGAYGVSPNDGRSGDALVVSFPRHLTKFRLTPEEQALLARGQAFTSAASSFALSSHPVVVSAPFHVSGIQNLARKISQKNKKLGTTRYCPSCKNLILRTKKRCPYCNEVLIGRRCQRCGVLNVNSMRECLSCSAPMPFSWGSKDGAFTDHLVLYI